MSAEENAVKTDRRQFINGTPISSFKIQEFIFNICLIKYHENGNF